MPIYQTAEDVKKEHAVVSVLEARTPMRFLEIKSITSPVDWAGYKGKELTHFVEIKNRTNTLNTYPTYMIDKSKVDKLSSIASNLGIGALVIVGFTDVIGVAKASDIQQNSTVGMGGRYDRNDSNDIDEVYYYPVDRFRVINR